MILVYSLLSENRDQIANQLASYLRSEARPYARMSRFELKESMTGILTAYSDYLISENRNKLKIVLGYWVKRRLSQSFQAGDILKATLSFGPVLRVFLQESFRKMPDDQGANFNKAMKLIEASVFNMADIVIELLDDHKQAPRPPKSVDLSKMMIYRG